MKDELFHLDLEGLTELEQYFDNMEKNVEEIMIDEYTAYGQLVEEGTKSLVQRDKSDLEDSISFDKARRVGNMIIVEGGSNSPYAVVRHEAPYRMGKHPKYDNGAKFPDYYINGRGEKTRSKGPWRGYLPGRKYMQNAINATKRDYDVMNERILDRITNGDEP